MRRLEILTESVPQRYVTPSRILGTTSSNAHVSSRHHSSGQPTPILHAFTHALSSILAYLRETVETIPSDLEAETGADARLTALWAKYEDMESILQALAALCGRVSAYMRCFFYIS